MTIEEFIEARLSEDGALALKASPGPWQVNDPSYPESIVDADGNANVSGGRWGGEARIFDTDEDALHIVRHDPARALIEIVAKRHALGFALAAFNQESKIEERPGRDPETNAYDKGRGDTARFMLRVLAAPYAEHPDFQAVWAVDAGGSNP